MTDIKDEIEKIVRVRALMGSRVSTSDDLAFKDLAVGPEVVTAALDALADAGLLRWEGEVKCGMCGYQITTISDRNDPHVQEYCCGECDIPPEADEPNELRDRWVATAAIPDVISTSSKLVEVIAGFYMKLHAAEWVEGDLEILGEPMLLTEVGQVALDLHVSRTPVRWCVRTFAFEGERGEPRAVGEAPDVPLAKTAAITAACALVPEILRFTLLEPA